MAKGASTEAQMGKLHLKLTELFLNILNKYENDLSAMDNVGEELLDELMAEGNMPNPAMLGAIAKFLKDNSISLESETLDELSEMEERLAAKKRARPNMASVTALPLISNTIN
tara:strand:- start:602 stop:940 length:339 start_codon:yes stop_codon:yes gene_type:complete